MLKKHSKSSMSAIVLMLCVMLGALTIGANALVTVPAGAAQWQTPNHTMAANAVQHATAMHHSHGSWEGGNPNQTPAVSTTPTGNVTASSNGTSLSVQLPNNPVNESQVGSNSVFDSASTSSTSVVNPSNGGLQISQELSGPSSPTSYSYQMNLPPGIQMVPQTTGKMAGSIALTSATGSTPLSQTNTVGFIQPAWAVDANGNSVPTSYSVSGNTLNQSVNTAGVTAWPVVADPMITFGWVIYIYFNHAEAGGVLLQAFVYGAAAAVGFACTILSVGWAVALCLGVFAFVAAYVVGIFATAYNRGGGVVWEFTYGGWYFGYEYVGSWS